MQTGVRAPAASSVSSAAAGVLVSVSDFAGVVGLSGDAPCHDRSGERKYRSSRKIPASL